jgi:hypothetical protein
VKYYLDEDISPKVAELLRKGGIEAVSAHHIGMTGASDEDQLSEAVSQKAAFVTRNRDDFIALTVQWFESLKPHYGLVVVSHRIPGSDFRLLVRMLAACARKNPEGLGAYSIEFINKP